MSGHHKLMLQNSVAICTQLINCPGIFWKQFSMIQENFTIHQKKATKSKCRGPNKQCQTITFFSFLHSDRIVHFIKPVHTRILNTTNWGWFTGHRYLFLIFDWRTTFQWIFFNFTSKKEKKERIKILRYLNPVHFHFT